MSEAKDTTSTTWREVGDQFRALGETLAAALRTTWESDETRRGLREMQDGVESMVDSLGQAIKEATSRPAPQQALGEARRVAASARAASQDAWQDAQPHLLSALRQANAELEKVISRMEGR